jgi:anaerobic magnesium-protoporphyrin IX monomethyl ester cyclase
MGKELSQESTATDIPEEVKSNGVLLITPPSIFLMDERVFVSLGILKVAAMLRRRGIPVQHLDLSGVENYIEVISDYIPNCGVKHIGLTTTTPQLPACVKVIRAIKELRSDVRIILGGPHVTLTHSAYKLELKENRVARAHTAYKHLQELAHVLVTGDGEFAIFEALATNPPTVIDGDDPKQELFMSNSVYEDTPFPARDLVDLSTYHYSIEDFRSTSLIGQLGCPFGCGFCGGRLSSSLRVVRTRTTESIIRELRMLHEMHGYTGFMFYDDELNISNTMIPLMNAITDLQSELGVEFRLRGFVKAQLLTEEQALAMYRAGFRWILSGFESGAPRILENINKRSTREENTRAVKLSRNAGLKVKALMSVGHPGESPETIKATQDWLLEVEPDDFDCTIITTYPGTPYYDEARAHPELEGVWTYTYKKTGDRLHSYDVDFLNVADYYKGDPDGGYKSFVFTDQVSAKEIVVLRDQVERTVREKLAIPYPTANSAVRYEHSMGQGANAGLPDHILRKSKSEIGAV